ncbi:MAG: Signal transduction histidine kinase [Dehalococcoidales bacterium]|nr:Signal transduction histidine kinase [Dehalococcoidales bacterium]
MGASASNLPRKWQDRTSNILSTYRFIGLAAALVLLRFGASSDQFETLPIILLILLGVYAVLRVVHPTRWALPGIVGYSLLAMDVLISAFATDSTGGIDSPFLLYTLAPVLTAALFMDTRMTVTVAGLTASNVIVAHLWNPLVSSALPMRDLSQLSMYLTAVCLAAALPYMVNMNLRQTMGYESTLLERQRLGRELHDGVSQTLSALRWQLQLLNRRLSDMGIVLNEAKQLEELIEKAQEGTTESLNLLTSLSTSGPFSNRLASYLSQVAQNIKVDFQAEEGIGEIKLEPTAELELMRICQEAVVNVRKHSGANSAKVQLKLLKNILQVKISDNGCGFAMAPYLHDGAQVKGHGLIGMRGRAESIGAGFEISSVPGKGTEVTVEVPLVH